jgi:hypothetical protein
MQHKGTSGGRRKSRLRCVSHYFSAGVFYYKITRFVLCLIRSMFSRRNLRKTLPQRGVGRSFQPESKRSCDIRRNIISGPCSTRCVASGRRGVPIPGWMGVFGVSIEASSGPASDPSPRTADAYDRPGVGANRHRPAVDLARRRRADGTWTLPAHQGEDTVAVGPRRSNS